MTAQTIEKMVIAILRNAEYKSAGIEELLDLVKASLSPSALFEDANVNHMLKKVIRTAVGTMRDPDGYRTFESIRERDEKTGAWRTKYKQCKLFDLDDYRIVRDKADASAWYFIQKSNLFVERARADGHQLEFSWPQFVEALET